MCASHCPAKSLHSFSFLQRCLFKGLFNVSSVPVLKFISSIYCTNFPGTVNTFFFSFFFFKKKNIQFMVYSLSVKPCTIYEQLNSYVIPSKHLVSILHRSCKLSSSSCFTLTPTAPPLLCLQNKYNQEQGNKKKCKC